MLSISTDSVHVHKAWEEHELSEMLEGSVPFPMLADPGGRIGSAYGVYDEIAGENIRGVFIIDPDGNILASEVIIADVGRNVDELIRQIRALQYARETGEVMPAGWQPGSDTLTPGADLVGKVWKTWKPDKRD